MKKLSILVILAILSMVVSGAFLQPPYTIENDQPEFKILYAGTPDEYGNQILNTTISQDVGGTFTRRGLVTESNYTQDADIYGFVNQSTRFDVVVSLNYSWADSSLGAEERTGIYLTVGSEITSEPMIHLETELVSADQGWIVSYRYLWDTEGKPDPIEYGVTIKYEATGPGQNYNLTFYDSGYERDFNKYFVDMSNTTDYSDYSYRCALASDGDLMTITQNDAGTPGFGAEDNAISLTVDIETNFIEISVTEITGGTWQLRLEDSNTDVTVTDSISIAGVYRFNLDYATGTHDIAKVRIISQDMVNGEYMVIDYIGFYGFDNWDHTSENALLQYGFSNGTGLEIVNMDAGDYALQRSGLSVVSLDSSLFIKYRSTVAFTVSYYNGSWTNINVPSSSGYTESRTDLELGTITQINIWITNGNASIKWLGIEDYGFLNQSLDNTNVLFYEYNSQVIPVDEGYADILEDTYFTSTGFKPLNGLGSVTLVSWVAINEPTNDRVMVSQYVDDNNRIEVGYDGDTEASGNFTFTIGNGSTYVRLEAPITVMSGTDTILFCVITSWEKENVLTLRINNTIYTSTETLNGVVSADDDLYIGPRDGSGYGSQYYYGLSMYYRQLTTSEQNIVYNEGSDYTTSYIYHHYGFNEIALGYGLTSSYLHGGEFITAVRETWILDYNGDTLAGYLYPNPLLYPDLYVWLAGWVLMALGPVLGRHKIDSAHDNKKTLFFIFVAGMISLIGLSIVLAGV